VAKKKGKFKRRHLRTFSSRLRNLIKALTITTLTKFVKLLIQVVTLWTLLRGQR
jgi:hypothetical protein